MELHQEENKTSCSSPSLPPPSWSSTSLFLTHSLCQCSFFLSLFSLSVFSRNISRSEESFFRNLPTWWKSTRPRQCRRRHGKLSARCPILSKRRQIWPTSKGLGRLWHQVTNEHCMHAKLWFQFQLEIQSSVPKSVLHFLSCFPHPSKK